MNSEKHRYFIINKPPNMVSQFVSSDNVGLLCDLDFNFPEGTHALGRLDNDSEGLLILTTNKKMTKLLFRGEKKHQRTYLVMVRNVVSKETLEELRAGISIRIKGGEQYVSAPCEVEMIESAKTIYPYAADSRDNYPHSWLLITLIEGKYHQVRKMVGTAQHRCYRLIRVSIGNVTLDSLPPGGVRELAEEELFGLLGM